MLRPEFSAWSYSVVGELLAPRMWQACLVSRVDGEVKLKKTTLVATFFAVVALSSYYLSVTIQVNGSLFGGMDYSKVTSLVQLRIFSNKDTNTMKL